MIGRSWLLALLAASALGRTPRLAAQEGADNPYNQPRAERLEDGRRTRAKAWRMERHGERLERRGERMERKGERWERRGHRLERRGYPNRARRWDRRGDRLEHRGERLERHGQRFERRGDQARHRVHRQGRRDRRADAWREGRI